MILEIKKTKEKVFKTVDNKGAVFEDTPVFLFKCSNKYSDKWSGTAHYYVDEQRIECNCLQNQKYDHCTHKTQAMEWLQLNTWKPEFDEWTPVDMIL